MPAANDGTTNLDARTGQQPKAKEFAPPAERCCVGRSRRAADWGTSSGGSSVFAGSGFQREVIAVAVRWYLRYGLSYRDVEELMAERGVTVDHVTVYP